MIWLKLLFVLLREAPKKILVRNLEEALGPYFKFEEALVPFSLFSITGRNGPPFTFLNFK